MAKRKKGKLTGAAKAAFLKKMAVGRAKKGRRKKPAANPPRKTRRKTPRTTKTTRRRRTTARALANPPQGALDATLTPVVAALVGGLSAGAVLAVVRQLTTDTTVHRVAEIVVPLAVAAAASRVAHPEAQAAAAGALGLAGWGVARAIASAVSASTNPPGAWWENPPRPDELQRIGRLALDADPYAASAPGPSL